MSVTLLLFEPVRNHYQLVRRHHQHGRHHLEHNIDARLHGALVQISVIGAIDTTRVIWVIQSRGVAVVSERRQLISFWHVVYILRRLASLLAR